MTAFDLSQRTFQPVRRLSFNVGTREHRVWHQFATSPKDLTRKRGAIMTAARQYDWETREPGKRNGALGHIGLELLERLLRVIDRTSGRLDPSYDWMAAAIKRSRQAVAAALQRLREHGFLDWFRRTEPVEGASGAEPRVKQATNAYWIKVPERVREIYQRLRGRAATDAKREGDLQADSSALGRLSASLGAEQLARGLVEPGAFSDALASLGAAFDRIERESTERSESGPTQV